MKVVLMSRSMTHVALALFAVHAEGCSDVAAREVPRHNAQIIATIEGADRRELLEGVRREICGCYGDEHKVEEITSDWYDWYPCCMKGPAAPKAVKAGYCAGQSQAFVAGTVDPRLFYPVGKCPVCSRYVGAKSGRVPRHQPKAVRA